MTTPVNELNQQSATTLYSESFGDVALSFAAISGAVGGAVGGAALGTQMGSVFPTVCGALGTMFGSVLVGCAWYMLEKLWKTTPAGTR